MSDLKIQQIPVSQIAPGNNDRKHFDQNALQDLATSISRDGLAQPITIRPHGDGYQIVAGERRFRAVNLLGWECIDAIVRELDDETASAIMLAENTGRADLNPIEEAEAYQVRIQQFGWNARKIAETAGVSEARVKGRLQLLELVPEAQHLVKFGHLPLGHARCLADLDSNRQRIALRVFNAAGSMSLSRFQEVVGQLLQEQQQESLFDLEQFLVAQVQEEPLALRGKKAKTGAPVREDLPQVSYQVDDSVATVIEKHILALLDAGQEKEAAVLGTVYDRLVKGNWLSIPAVSELRNRAAAS